MPGLLSIFRGQRPRQFDFKSRYYNEERESMRKRVKAIEFEVEEERKAAMNGTNLTRAKLDEEWKRSRLARSNNDYSKRLVTIAAILAMVVSAVYYFVLTGN